jgi:hypothetical protein
MRNITQIESGEIREAELQEGALRSRSFVTRKYGKHIEFREPLRPDLRFRKQSYMPLG